MNKNPKVLLFSLGLLFIFLLSGCIITEYSATTKQVECEEAYNAWRNAIDRYNEGVNKIKNNQEWATQYEDTTNMFITTRKVLSCLNEVAQSYAHRYKTSRNPADKQFAIEACRKISTVVKVQSIGDSKELFNSNANEFYEIECFTSVAEIVEDESVCNELSPATNVRIKDFFTRPIHAFSTIFSIDINDNLLNTYEENKCKHKVKMASRSMNNANCYTGYILFGLLISSYFVYTKQKRKLESKD